MKLHIKKLADYITLNAYSVYSSGLYSGKAGLSLCLFEIARYLKDNEIEEHAFKILQESLVLIPREDISFSHGLSGAGFTLLYLIRNKFIEADFIELFEDKLDKIICTLNQFENYNFNHLYITLFLEIIPDHYKSAEIKSIRNKILNDVKIEINAFWENFENKKLDLNKIRMQNYFEHFLKVLSLQTEPISNIQLEEFLHNYTFLYKKNKIVSSLSTGFYLEKIASELKDERIKEVALENINKGALNVYLPSLKLSTQINFLFLLSKKEDIYFKQLIYLEKDLFTPNFHSFEKNIFLKIPLNSFIPGYREGISRLILYYIYRNYHKDHENCFRFSYLF